MTTAETRTATAATATERVCTDALTAGDVVETSDGLEHSTVVSVVTPAQSGARFYRRLLFRDDTGEWSGTWPTNSHWNRLTAG